MFYEVIPIQQFRKSGGILTYSSDKKLTPGQIVEIPLGKKSTYGIVYQSVKSVDFLNVLNSFEINSLELLYLETYAFYGLQMREWRL